MGREDLSQTQPTPPEADPSWAYFLDIDGTLLEIAATPSSVLIDGGLLQLVERLSQVTGGAVALVSGRSLDDIVALFGPLRLPVAGLHGLERIDPDGTVHRDVRDDGVLPAQARDALRALERQRRGVLLEDKGRSVAMHYRQAPEHGPALVDAMVRMAAESGGRLLALAGKMVVELKPAHMDKGKVVAQFMAQPPFAGRLPVYLGDDVTDEDAFAEVSRRGGLSVKVGEGPSGAAWRLPDVGSVRAWIARCVAQAEGGQP